ncbi:MAG: hypothetical protein KC618_09205, partial [Candidatus Omnitrophica bacterium]|nr:hypothetical protein [Candidatus Omnitrophota bacterium]
MTKFSTVSDNRPGKFCICPYFCILLVLELIFFLYAVMSWRMPSIHDGFQYFSLQYYFFNHQVIYGDIPQWMPFMTHGTVASWWYTLQACVAHNALGIAAGVFKHINFIPVFHIGVLVDRLIFLIGIWLWGTRLFSSKQTNFFVSVTVMMSCIWMSQFWFNFHFYYTIPLMLYFGHRFFETGQWRYVVLGGNLLFLQFLSTLPYQIGVVTLVSGL